MYCLQASAAIAVQVLLFREKAVEQRHAEHR